MINTEFDPIYASGASYSVTDCFGEDCAKAIEECIEKKQEAYEAALEAQEDKMIEAVLAGNTYDAWFNITNEQPQFGASTPEDVKKLMESGLENVALECDIDTTEFSIINNDITIDLKGHHLNRDVSDKTSNAPVFFIKEGTLTIKGNGDLSSEGSAAQYCHMCIWCAGENAKVVIEDGKFWGSAWNDGIRTESAAPSIYSQEGVIEILGGEFKSAWSPSLGSTFNPSTGQNVPGSYTVLNCLDKNYKAGKANIVVKGGKFFNFNPIACTSENPATNYVAEGYTVMVDGVECLEKWNLGMGDTWYEVVKK